ncbi:MAG: shikimate dehydrogenase [Bacteroidetes bacterium]|nr:shikimate dehydrogenase [Bacteroidota bacterium]
MRVFGLIGNPLTHSFSGSYFEKKFRELGLHDHVYNLYSLPDLSEFASWVRRVDGLEGLNVTIPYKKSILPYLDEICLPEGLVTCNCIHLRDNKLIGYNTDVIGFANSLKPLLKPHHQRALVLGQGGAAEAVCHVLKQWQIPFRQVGREASVPGGLTYSMLTSLLIEEHPLLIHTTPLGTYPNVSDYPPIPYEGIGPNHLLYDLVYNPERTVFLSKGAERGAIISNGWNMLVGQAEASWSIWNGNLLT